MLPAAGAGSRIAAVRRQLDISREDSFDPTTHPRSQTPDRAFGTEGTTDPGIFTEMHDTLALIIGP